jgi:hypothetical protein
MAYIDISLTRANEMPIYIDQPLGYSTDTVTIKGGIRSYHWVKIFGWGIEIAVARKVVNKQRNKPHGHSSFGEAATHHSHTRHRS